MYSYGNFLGITLVILVLIQILSTYFLDPDNMRTPSSVQEAKFELSILRSVMRT